MNFSFVHKLFLKYGSRRRYLQGKEYYTVKVPISTFEPTLSVEKMNFHQKQLFGIFSLLPTYFRLLRSIHNYILINHEWNTYRNMIENVWDNLYAIVLYG